MARETTSTDPIATVLANLAVLALGLTAGALLAEGALLVPFWQSLAPEAFLAWYAGNASLLFNFFAPLEIASAVLALAAAVVYRFRRRSGTGLLAVAAALALVILVAFPLYFKDVNASFAAGTIDPAEVPAELARWAKGHWIRTAMAIVAFAAALLGAQKKGD